MKKKRRIGTSIIMCALLMIGLFSSTLTSKDTYATSLSLGPAGDYHIFANEINLHAHTNGNIATPYLKDTNSNFGTTQLKNKGLKETSYIQKLDTIISSSWADPLIISSQVTTSSMDNGNAIGLQTKWGMAKLDHIKNVVVDDNYIDFEKEFNYLNTLSFILASFETSEGIALDDKDFNHGYIKALGEDVQVINLTYSQLSRIMDLEVNDINMDSETVIINVDMANAPDTFYVNTKTYLKDENGTAYYNAEHGSFEKSRILWNFFDSSTGTSYDGALMFQKSWMGTILAPNADVTARSNIDGTIICDTFDSYGETHRWDFSGELPQVNTEIPDEPSTDKESDENPDLPDLPPDDMLEEEEGVPDTPKNPDNSEKEPLPETPNEPEEEDTENTQPPIENKPPSDEDTSIPEEVPSGGEEVLPEPEIPQPPIIPDTPEIETMEISGTLDFGEFTEDLPENVDIDLTANKEVVDSTQTNKEVDWEFAFEDVAVYEEDGDTEIDYTLEITPEGDAWEPSTVPVTSAPLRFSMMRAQPPTPEIETITVVGVVIFDINGDEIPEEITVELHNQNGYSQDVIVTQEDEWMFTFFDLPVTDEDGNDVEYTALLAPSCEKDTWTVTVSNNEETGLIEILIEDIQETEEQTPPAEDINKPDDVLPPEEDDTEDDVKPDDSVAKPEENEDILPPGEDKDGAKEDSPIEEEKDDTDNSLTDEEPIPPADEESDKKETPKEDAEDNLEEQPPLDETEEEQPSNEETLPPVEENPDEGSNPPADSEDSPREEVPPADDTSEAPTPEEDTENNPPSVDDDDIPKEESDPEGTIPLPDDSDSPSKDIEDDIPEEITPPSDESNAPESEDTDTKEDTDTPEESFVEEDDVLDDTPDENPQKTIIPPRTDNKSVSTLSPETRDARRGHWPIYAFGLSVLGIGFIKRKYFKVR